MLIQVFITVGISQVLVLALLLCLKKGRKTADLILAMELNAIFKKFTQQIPREYIRHLQTLPIAGSSLS